MQKYNKTTEKLNLFSAGRINAQISAFSALFFGDNCPQYRQAT